MTIEEGMDMKNVHAIVCWSEFGNVGDVDIEKCLIGVCCDGVASIIREGCGV